MDSFLGSNFLFLEVNGRSQVERLEHFASCHVISARLPDDLEHMAVMFIPGEDQTGLSGGEYASPWSGCGADLQLKVAKSIEQA
jgi:hypothetical protein